MRSRVRAQFIDYNAIYGTGGLLCYRSAERAARWAHSHGSMRPPRVATLDFTRSRRVEPCVQMLAIQNTCGATCCRDGPEGDAAFADAAANHNFDSNNGPGPWLIATLDQFDDARQINFGAGLHDVSPCPLDPMCNPSACTSDPKHPGQTYGCYRCNEVARVGYIFTEETTTPAEHLMLTVTDTVQRGETTSRAACYYLATIKIFSCALGVESLVSPTLICQNQASEDTNIKFYQVRTPEAAPMREFGVAMRPFTPPCALRKYTVDSPLPPVLHPCFPPLCTPLPCPHPLPHNTQPCAHPCSSSSMMLSMELVVGFATGAFTVPKPCRSIDALEHATPLGAINALWHARFHAVSQGGAVRTNARHPKHLRRHVLSRRSRRRRRFCRCRRQPQLQQQQWPWPVAGSYTRPV